MKIGKHRDKTCCPWSSWQTESRLLPLMPLGDFNLSLIALAISFSIQREFDSCAIKFILHENIVLRRTREREGDYQLLWILNFPTKENVLRTKIPLSRNFFPFRENFVLDIQEFVPRSPWSFLCTSSRCDPGELSTFLTVGFSYSVCTHNVQHQSRSRNLCGP